MSRGSSRARAGMAGLALVAAFAAVACGDSPTRTTTEAGSSTAPTATTATTTPSSAPTTTAPAAPETTAPPAPPSSGAAPTTSTPDTPPSTVGLGGSESTDPGTYDESSDNGAYLIWPDGGAGSATSVVRGQTERVAFIVMPSGCTTPVPNACAHVTITNTSGHVIQLPGGLAVDLDVARCDLDPSTAAKVSINDPFVTELQAGDTAALDIPFTLTEPGQYCLSAHTVIVIV